MASDIHRPPDVTQGASAPARQDEKSAKSKVSLWQQLSAAGSQRVKRKLQAPSNSGQHRAGMPGLHRAARRTEQQHRQTLGRGLQRQAQPGRGGVTDLGDGVRILYSPSMFSKTEAAQLLRALQVTDHIDPFVEKQLSLGLLLAMLWTADASDGPDEVREGCSVGRGGLAAEGSHSARQGCHAAQTGGVHGR